MTPFILLTFPRTGSTYVRIWLNNHSQIRCHGELFLPGYGKADGFRAHCRAAHGDRIRHALFSNRILARLPLPLIPDAFVDAFMHRLLRSPDFPSPWVPQGVEQPDTVGDQPKPCVGFKAMYNHITCNRRLQHWIERDNFSILHLIRENLLKQYVSLVRMKQTGRSHSYGKPVVHVPVHIDVRRLGRHIEKMRRRTGAFRARYAASHPYMEFSYEDFFADPAAMRTRITAFLGVPDEPMQEAGTKRTSTNSLDKEIANAAEVVRWIEKTPYAHFLDAYT